MRPRVGSYAYGDYYAARYSRAGYQPWAVYGAKARDPLYNYYNWANRGERNWQRNLVTTYQERSRGEAAVPPRTLAAQKRLQAREKNVSATNYLSTISDRDKFADVLDKEWTGTMPYTVLIGPGGKVVYRKSGEIEPLEVRRKVVDFLGRTYANRALK